MSLLSIGWFDTLLLFSFIVGGVWVTLATVIGERFGSKLGGLISGTPSTVVVTFLFIALGQSVEAVVDATTIFPLVFGFTGLFLLSYAAFAAYNYATALIGSLAIWLAASFGVIFFHFESFQIATIIFLLVFAGGFYVFEYLLKLPSSRQVKVQHTLGQLIGRALFSGFMVAFAVFLSRVAGPVWGGVFAAFPAASISTLVITHKSSGMYVSRAMAKSIYMSSMVVVPLYGVSLRYLYPEFGIWLGTLIAYMMSIIVIYFLYYKLIKPHVS